MTEIEFPTDLLKTCWFSTLDDLGYSTSVAIHNPLPADGLTADDLHIGVTMFHPDGTTDGSTEPVAVLSPGDRTIISVDDVLGPTNDGDRVGMVHLVPGALRHRRETSLDIDDLLRWTTVCDEFVGYTHRLSGIQSGVHYQSPPMNDARLPSTRTIIVQSPKVVVDHDVDTSLLVFVPSSDADFDEEIELRIVILDPDGQVHARSSTTVRARTRSRISVWELLDANGAIDRFVEAGGLGMLIALATGGVVTPLTLTHSARGGLAIDHSLPPPYYVPWWGGQPRRRATEALIDRFFPEAVFR